MCFLLEAFEFIGGRIELPDTPCMSLTKTFCNLYQAMGLSSTAIIAFDDDCESPHIAFTPRNRNEMNEPFITIESALPDGKPAVFQYENLLVLRQALGTRRPLLVEIAPDEDFRTKVVEACLKRGLKELFGF